jgi:predicted O-methyltransferase YrrM
MKKNLLFIFRLLKIALKNPKDIRHVIGSANAAAIQFENPKSDTRIFPKIEYSSILPDTGRFYFQTFRGVEASVTLTEAAALAALIQLSKAKRVFEFGTYKGVSTTQLALNLPTDGIVYTLDLPEDHPVYLEYSRLASETGMKILVPENVVSKVQFLKSDSAKFDTEPYRNSIDLVFVDGYHSYEYVKNDTEKGWEMLRPGGVIAWHDCVPDRPEIIRYLKSLHPLPRLVESTSLAFAIKHV